MSRRVASAVGVVAVIGAVVGATQLPLSGQSPSTPLGARAAVPPLVITAFNGEPTPAYTVPRTPWGDPDLQGTWSSDDATWPGS